MNISLRDIEISGAPPLQCRAVFSTVTFAHVAGLPLKPNDEINPVNLQKLETRVPKQFGNVPFHVLQPELVKHYSGTFAFPKVERMAFLLAEDTSEALVLVWYEPEDDCFMSDDNVRKLKKVQWHEHARVIKKNK